MAYDISTSLVMETAQCIPRLYQDYLAGGTPYPNKNVQIML